MACSVCMLNGVSHQSPIDGLKTFLKSYPPSGMKMDPVTKKYTSTPFLSVIHVIFGGPDMRTLKEGKGHYSKVGSCNAFADYLRANNLGTVVESPGVHNPLHNERVPGEGDVICYIWTPDPKAVYEWYLKHPI